MEELYSQGKNISTKRFLISALITESIAVVVLIALLLSIRFITPKFFKTIRNFYTENICFNVMDETEG